MTNTLPDTGHTPYIGFALSYEKAAYWVYLINPSPSVEYAEIDFYTGAHDEDISTSRVYKKLDGLKPLHVMLLEQSHIDGLDFSIWFHLDLFTKDGVKIPVWFSLPKYAGFGASEKQQTILDCGIYAMKIPLEKRDGRTVKEQAELDKGLNKNNL